MNSKNMADKFNKLLNDSESLTLNEEDSKEFSNVLSEANIDLLYNYNRILNNMNESEFIKFINDNNGQDVCIGKTTYYVDEQMLIALKNKFSHLKEVK